MFGKSWTPHIFSVLWCTWQKNLPAQPLFSATDAPHTYNYQSCRSRLLSLSVNAAYRPSAWCCTEPSTLRNFPAIHSPRVAERGAAEWLPEIADPETPPLGWGLFRSEPELEQHVACPFPSRWEPAESILWRCLVALKCRDLRARCIGRWRCVRLARGSWGSRFWPERPKLSQRLLCLQNTNHISLEYKRNCRLGVCKKICKQVSSNSYLELGFDWRRSRDRQARAPRECAVWQTWLTRPFPASLPVSRRRCTDSPEWWRRRREPTGRLYLPSGWALSMPVCRWPVFLSPAKCFIG